MSIRVEHLPCAHVRVVGGNIGPLHEAQAEQLAGRVERRALDIFQHEIRLQLGFIERILRLTHALGVMPPIPLLDALVDAVRARHLHQSGSFGDGLALACRPYLVGQPRDRLWRARHGVEQPVFGVIGVAQEACTFCPQRQDFRDQRTVVMGARMFSPRHPGQVCRPPQVAPGREGQEWFDRRPRQGDRIALDPQLRCGLPRALACETGQAIEVTLAQIQVPGALVMHHVLAEFCVQRGEALGGFAKPHLRRNIESGSVSHEAEMPPLKQPQCVRRQPKAVPTLVQIVDTSEQRWIERDSGRVACQPGREVAFDRLQFAGAQACDQIREYAGCALEQRPTQFKRLDRVGEARRLRISGDRLDLGDLLGHAPLQGLGDMFGPDAIEGWHAEGGGPGLEERVDIHGP